MTQDWQANLTDSLCVRMLITQRITKAVSRWLSKFSLFKVQEQIPQEHSKVPVIKEAEPQEKH